MRPEADRVFEARRENSQLSGVRVRSANEATRRRPLLLLSASYEDHLPRALNFHLKQEAGLDFRKKLVRLSLPSPASIRAHPNMALIPETNWLQGPDRKVESNHTAYWIDLYPVTVREYLPTARAAVQTGDRQCWGLG